MRIRRQSIIGASRPWSVWALLAFVALPLALVATPSLARMVPDTTIAGVIRDATTGAPLSGICVTFYNTATGPPPGWAGFASSGDNGAFSFAPAAAGGYDLGFYRPSAPGDCDSTPAANQPVPLWYRDVALTPGPPRQLVPPTDSSPVQTGTLGLDICLGSDTIPRACATPGSISGHVVTTGSVPVQGACIFVISSPPSSAGPAQAITGPTGAYQAEGVPVNTNLVVAIAPPFTSPQGPCATNGPPSFPPGSLQPVWFDNVWLNAADPNLTQDPFGTAVAAGATVVQAVRTDIDACLTDAPGTQVPRPNCTTTSTPVGVSAAVPVFASPRFTG